ESFVSVSQSVLRSEIAKECAELRMAKPFLLIARVESQIWNSSDCRAARVGARVQVHKNVRLFDAKRCVPTIVPGVSVLRDGPASEDHRVGSFVIDRVRPTVRVFPDTVGESGFESIELAVE